MAETTTGVSRAVENLAGMAACVLAFTSLAFSIHFPLSLGGGVFVGTLLALAFLAFVAVQYTAAFWLTAFWRAGQVGLVLTALLLMLCTVVISIVAGQSFLQDVTAAREKELLAASDAYQTALAARQAAQRKAAASALSRAAYEEAAAGLQTAQAALRSIHADNAAWVADWAACTAKEDRRGLPYTTRAQQACAAAAGQAALIAAQQRTVSAWQTYQANLEHAERLSAAPLPAAGDGLVPGFRSIANLTGIPYALIRDNFWLLVSVFVEAAAQCCFIFWGWNRRRRAEKTPETAPKTPRRPFLPLPEESIAFTRKTQETADTLTRKINTHNGGEYQTGSLKARRCWYCHETYTPKAPHQKYCCEDHRLLWHGIKPNEKGRMLENKLRKYAELGV